MKILYLTHRLPWPPNRGDKIRSYHLIEHLARTHEVALLSFQEERSRLAVKKLSAICRPVQTVSLNYFFAKIKGSLALFFNQAISIRSFSNLSFWKKYQTLLYSFNPDLVFVDSSAMAIYPYRSGTSFYADFMDVDSEKWRQFSLFSKGALQWIYKRESRKLALHEKKIALKAKAVLVVSETEKERLFHLEPKANVVVIPLGVDPKEFSPQSASVPKANHLVFTGVLNYYPNINAVRWFCREIWPKIRAKKPDAIFRIVGANPTYAVWKLEAIAGVQVIANVPHIQPYLAEAEVCVLPLRFSIGIQNKLLEALAMGKPVVATSGVLQGTVSSLREAVHIADKPNDFAEQVLALLENPSERKVLQLKGPQIVEQFYRWEKNLSALDRLLSK